MRNERGWIVVSVPGRREDGSDTGWYAYHGELGISSSDCGSFKKACEEVKRRRESEGKRS